MEIKNVGYYLAWIKKYVIESWELLEKPQNIKAHHVISFLLAVILLDILSYIISKVFKTAVKLCIMISLFWLLWMMLFSREKYNELFLPLTRNENSEEEGII
jgi:hypothetical protein